MAKKLKPLKYDDRIENIEILINQLASLKYEARLMYTQDLVFRRDWSALAIVIQFLKENKEVLEDE